MNFNEAVIKLGIQEYADRIYNSNSRGELSHLNDYIFLATTFPDPELFAKWFKDAVLMAEKHWKRPESVFQYIPRLLLESLKEYHQLLN